MIAFLDVQCNNTIFGRSQSAFSEICNLSMLCFETNTFPSACASLKQHEISLLNTHSSLDVIISSAEGEIRAILNSTKNSSSSIDKEQCGLQLKETLNSDPQTMDKDKLSSNTDDTCIGSIKNSIDSPTITELTSDSVHVLIENPALCENYTLLEGESCPWCVIDKCRACFVLRYFPIMNFARIRVILSSTQKCRWRTWLAYVVTLKCEWFIFLIQQVFLLDIFGIAEATQI